MAATPGDRPPAARRVAWAAAAALLFVLPFSSSAALRNALLAIATACVLHEAVRGTAAAPRLPPWRVLGPFLAWSAWSLASVTWSVDPAYSISELRPGLLYPLVAFLVFHALTVNAAGIDRWAWAIAAGLFALALVALAEIATTGGWEPGHWHGDAGFYATHVVLALPLLAWLWLRRPEAGLVPRIVLALAAALTLYVMSWNDNRVAWVVLAAMSVLAVALAWPTLEPARRRGIVAATAAGIAVFAVFFVASVGERAARLAGTPHAPEARLAQDPRPAIWDYAARRHGEAPWVGHGYGRGILQYDFRTRVIPGTENPKHAHAHNTALNALLQGGVVGFALFAWTVAALVREMARGLAEDAPRRAVAILGLTLAAGFALRNQVDDFLVRHSALLAWALAGAVLGALRPTCARTPA